MCGCNGLRLCREGVWVWGILWQTTAVCSRLGTGCKKGGEDERSEIEWSEMRGVEWNCRTEMRAEMRTEMKLEM